ncbi:MAG: helix-turn-helix domain-containing protein [Agathobaculum sp.]|jgi:transcriptional regulator with XRE-family HTH domain|uniref:helix-turn-helix domain-containing protein n=1 Tax=Agathobaculum sp. TaxID=2048138 RepID=UPI003D89EA81
MKFGEKVRLLRKEKKLSQTELGKLCGLSLRTIRNYEVNGRYPKQREVYTKLADALGCEVNFLLSEEEIVALKAQQGCSSRGIKEAEKLVAKAAALFSGEELNEQAKDGVMKALQNAYWLAKEKRREAQQRTRQADED